MLVYRVRRTVSPTNLQSHQHTHRSRSNNALVCTPLPASLPLLLSRSPGGYQPATSPVTFAVGLLAQDGSRSVLVGSKSPEPQTITVTGASGGSWAVVDEATGFGPWRTENLASDTFTIAPYAAGVVTFAS